MYILFLLAVLTLVVQPVQAQPVNLETMRGKSILLFTPHPDDDMFCCAGTLAMLVEHGNTVRIVIYTNDDKGSKDPDMTSERLARIRKNEQEAASKILGIGTENILWMPHHDGMLEYVPSKELVEQTTAIIRRYKPDVVLSIDPGSETVRWHKTDHRMAAMNTLDAVRAAEWHLYFPNQRLHQGLEPHAVPVMAFYYVTDKDANYWVNIDKYVDRKLDAAAAHVSLFEPSTTKYRDNWEPAELAKMKAWLKGRMKRRDGHAVEAFRITGSYNPQ